MVAKGCAPELETGFSEPRGGRGLTAEERGHPHMRGEDATAIDKPRSVSKCGTPLVSAVYYCK